MKYLLDTCVISEYTKPNPNGGLHAWLQNTDDVLKAISVVSLGEIQSGISRLPEGKRRHRLQQWLENELVPRFESRILSVDLADTLRWGVLTGEAKKQGETLPSVDALLAATALNRQLTLVTRNTKDFQRCGVTLLNPWETTPMLS